MKSAINTLKLRLRDLTRHTEDPVNDTFSKKVFAAESEEHRQAIDRLERSSTRTAIDSLIDTATRTRCLRLSSSFLMIGEVPILSVALDGSRLMVIFGNGTSAFLQSSDVASDLETVALALGAEPKPTFREVRP